MDDPSETCDVELEGDGMGIELGRDVLLTVF